MGNGLTVTFGNAQSAGCHFWARNCKIIHPVLQL
eukprot:COSAG02_NODE_59513_length_274_cov_0.588571_1_plen_33_part_01